MQTDFSSYTKALQWSLQAELKTSDALAGNFSCVEDTQGLEKWMQEQGVRAVIAGDADYPYALQAGDATTKIVYGIGDWWCLEMPRLSIVGPRKPSLYATQVLDCLCTQIESRRLCIVSWGAPWIDQQAHRGAIAHGLPTIVVLWCGLYVAMKSSLRELLQRVVAWGGLVLSAWKLKQTPTNFTFPQRNKLIAGLGEILFVPAAGQKSWSLITVDFAHKMHKHMYTVPASIFEQESAGTNELLVQKKAHAVISFEHMLDAHFPRLDMTPTEVQENLTDAQQTICTYLALIRVASTQELLNACACSLSEILEALVELEMKRLVIQKGPDAWSLV